MKKKMKCSNNELFVLTKINTMLSKKAGLFNMPNGTCFTYCINEMIDVCGICDSINNKTYLDLVDSFLEYMKKDRILKELDCYIYVDLLCFLKKIRDDKKMYSCRDIKRYFSVLQKTYKKSYLESLKNKMLNIDDISDYEYIDIITNSYVNELLSAGYSYNYLRYVFNCFYKDKESLIFSDYKDLIKFLDDSFADNIDMYLPLKCYDDRDIKYITNQYSDQKILTGEEIMLKDNQCINLVSSKYYCHVYFNRNDYYKGLEEHLKRVKSIFNVLKFYTNSKVDIDYNDNVFIKSKKMGVLYDKSIESLLSYSYYRGNYKVINCISKTFKNLKDENSKVLEDIYDILNYSQKDSDFLNNDQFISKWISLEMTVNKSRDKHGFDAVKKYIPDYLTLSFFNFMISNDIENIYGKKINLSDFIDLINSGKTEEISKKIKNPYYMFKLNYYNNLLSNITVFIDEINKYKQYLIDTLYRIYILRNKYVHNGNTDNYNDILKYLLNIIEPYFLDKVFKILTRYVERGNRIEHFKWDIVFDELDYKYAIINNVLEFIIKDKKNNNIKIDDKLSINYNSLCSDNYTNLIKHLLLDHHLKLNDIVQNDYCDVEIDNIE